MNLSNIKSKTKNKNPKRRGRGTGSNLGKTGGRGHKGAGQRKGKKLPYAGFRGGNLPYYRVIPKRGFKPPRIKEIQVVNLGQIQERLKKESEITPEVLKAANLINDSKLPVKVLAKTKDDFILKIVFKADAFSKKAKELIEQAGGKTELIKRVKVVS